MDQTHPITQENFQELWLSILTEKQRKTRAEKALRIIVPVATQQFKILKKFEESGGPDGLRFTYFRETLKNIWDCVDFVLSLGKGKNRVYAFYPARTILENTFRLEFFTRQKNIKDQEDIALKECLRICKRNYDSELSAGNNGDADKYKQCYKSLAPHGNFLSIDDIDVRSLEPFPNMKVIMGYSKIEGRIKWYYHYQALAESSHGKLMHIIMNDQHKNEQYRLALMYTTVMCNEILKITDFHLQGKTRKEVVEAIQKAESIVKKPV